MNPDYADPERDRRAFLLEILKAQEGHEFSLYGTGVSSVLEATDLIIDLLLQTSQLLKEGTSLSEQVNPEIGFSEWHQDALGNPKQFRIVESRKQYWNEPLGDELLALAESFVRLKATEFEGSLYLPTLSPANEVHDNRSKCRDDRSEKKDRRSAKAQKYYHVRHTRRKTEQKKHSNQPKVGSNAPTRFPIKGKPRIKGYSSISPKIQSPEKVKDRRWKQALIEQGKFSK
jgi:hypothetical protein